jgi:hypothetical protein
MIRWSQALLGIAPPQVMWLNAVAYAGFKVASILLLLCPGLGLRICGSAMKA